MSTCIACFPHAYLDNWSCITEATLPKLRIGGKLEDYDITTWRWLALVVSQHDLYAKLVLPAHGQEYTWGKRGWGRDGIPCAAELKTFIRGPVRVEGDLELDERPDEQVNGRIGLHSELILICQRFHQYYFKGA